MGVPSQQTITFPSPPRFNWRFISPIPKIAPTTAWEVATGKPSMVMIVTVAAADREEITACCSVSDVNPFSVSMPAWPSKRAPIRTQTVAKPAAVRNFNMRDETADPITLEASLAPNDQPKKIPLKRENIKLVSSSE